jgi:hypothetical protein
MSQQRPWQIEPEPTLHLSFCPITIAFTPPSLRDPWQRSRPKIDANPRICFNHRTSGDLARGTEDYARSTNANQIRYSNTQGIRQNNTERLNAAKPA